MIVPGGTPGAELVADTAFDTKKVCWVVERLGFYL